MSIRFLSACPSVLSASPCKAPVIPGEASCEAASLGLALSVAGEDEAMVGEKLSQGGGSEGDASGTKLPSDAGTNTRIHQRKVVQGGAILKLSV